MHETTARKVLANIDHLREQDKQAVDVAQAELTKALAKEPWVKALIELAAAKRRTNTTIALKAQAEHALNPKNDEVPAHSVTSITTSLQGDKHPGFIIDPLVNLIDSTAQDREQADRESAMGIIESWLQTLEDTAPTETYPHILEDGRKLTITRNLITGVTVAHNADGSPYKAPKTDKPADANMWFEVRH